MNNLLEILEVIIVLPSFRKNQEGKILKFQKNFKNLKTYNLLEKQSIFFL